MAHGFTLEGLRRVMKELNCVNETLPVISVAGTNGKGSLVSFLNSILIKAGIKTGAYISPHIFHYAERISIDGAEIGISEFRLLLKLVRKAVKTAGVTLSRFETITAAGILHFHRQKCGISVMEAGLGGRLDATNVCENKILSVITPVSLEHTRLLGDTVEKIAREKAGIIKPGRPVVDASGVPVIREAARAAGCPVYQKGREYCLENVRQSGDGKYSYDLYIGKKTISGLSPGMRGIHQADNSAQAAVAAWVLGINCPAIKAGIASAENPGRLQSFELGEKRKLIVDAAHNPAGILALREFLETRPSGSELYLIMSVFNDKDYFTMAELLDPVVKRAWTFTSSDERALDARKLARLFKDGRAAESFTDAFRAATGVMKSGDWLVACGSFSAVSPALKYVNENLY